MIAPTLTTERLTLRMPVMADYPTYAAFWATDRSAGLGGPTDVKGTWAWFCHDVAQWSLFGLGAWAMERRADGALIGQVILSDGPLFPEVELGWFLYDGFEGQGYMVEAATAARDWGFGVRGLPTMVSYVAPENTASARVAERLGAVIDPAAPLMDGRIDHVYRYARPGVRA